MKQNILATGINGLVGSKLTQLYADRYHFDVLDISDSVNPVDITNQKSTFKAVANSPAQVLLHFAAYTNVTGAWQQRGDKNGLAWQVNVVGTQNIVDACKRYNKHLVHISTAYVFNGQKEGLYTEEDELSPIEWYGETKAEAEKIVRSSEIDWTILRIDQPFRSDEAVRPDVVRRIIQGLKSNSLYPQFTNHYFGPTFIDDFAKIVNWVIQTKTTGIFNSSSGEKWTDYDFAQLINKTLKLNKEINKGDLKEYLKTLDRPYQRNTAMSNQKLTKQLNFKLKTIKEAVKEVVNA